MELPESFSADAISPCESHCFEDAVKAATDAVAALRSSLSRSSVSAAQAAAGCSKLSRAVVTFGDAAAEAVVAQGGVAAAIEAMHVHLCDLDVQVRAMGALNHLAKFSHCADAMAGQGAVEALAAAMKAHRRSASAQVRGIVALGRIAEFGGQAAANALLRMGGLDTVIAAMRERPANTDIQIRGCAALACIPLVGLEEADALALSKRGALETITAAMRHHVENADMQIRGAVALGSFVSFGAAQTLVVCTDGGEADTVSAVVDALVAGMQAHPRSLDVQVRCTFALALIAISCKELGVEAIIRHGGVAAAIACARTHFDSSDAQIIVASVLGRVAEFGQKAGASLVIGAGAVEVLVAGMAAHIEDPRVQQQLASALGHLAEFGEEVGATTLVKQGGIEALISGMKVRGACADLQCNAIAALDCIATYGGAAACRALLAKGCVSTALAAMKAHPGNVEVQSTASAALASIANSNRKVSSQVLKEGGLDAVVSWMRTSLDSSLVQSNGACAIAMLLACQTATEQAWQLYSRVSLHLPQSIVAVVEERLEEETSNLRCEDRGPCRGALAQLSDAVSSVLRLPFVLFDCAHRRAFGEEGNDNFESSSRTLLAMKELVMMHWRDVVALLVFGPPALASRPKGSLLFVLVLLCAFLLPYNVPTSERVAKTGRVMGMIRPMALGATWMVLAPVAWERSASQRDVAEFISAMPTTRDNAAYVAEVFAALPTTRQNAAFVADMIATLPSTRQNAACVANMIATLPSTRENAALVAELVARMPSTRQNAVFIAELIASLPTTRENARLILDFIVAWQQTLLVIVSVVCTIGTGPVSALLRLDAIAPEPATEGQRAPLLRA